MKLLKSVIEAIDSFPWDYMIYVSHQYPWNENTLCLVLDPTDNDSDNPDEEPLVAKQLGLKEALGVSETQEIVINLKSQTPNIKASDLVKAFNYYFANDAFMEL
jgi:hypothetical protein